MYRGSYHRHWQGLYFLGDFGTGQFWGLRRDGAATSNRALAKYEGWPISTFGHDEEGEIYFARYGANGIVYRLADEKPALRADRIDNAASGRTGVSPGARLVVAGMGLSAEPGFIYAKSLADEELAGFRIWFGEQPGRIAESYNLGGREALVVVAPEGLNGEAVLVRVERNGISSEPVEVRLTRTSPGLFGGIVEEIGPGEEATFLATGVGTFTSDGACAESVTAAFGETPGDVLSCSASRDYAGVAEIRVRAPMLPSGLMSFAITAAGSASPEVSLRIR